VSDAALKFTLHHGPLGFSARSQGEGPLVLCLHGFPDNASSYRHQLPVLAQAGYRAVSVTLRGYEPSSQPADDDYSLASIAGDVVAFIDELGAERAHLVGHDWGAAIAYTAGAASPERFMTLTTMAVPHAGRFLNEVVRYPKQLRLSWYMGFFQLRGFADRTVEREDFAFIRRLWRDWSPAGGAGGRDRDPRATGSQTGGARVLPHGAHSKGAAAERARGEPLQGTGSRAGYYRRG